MVIILLLVGGISASAQQVVEIRDTVITETGWSRVGVKRSRIRGSAGGALGKGTVENRAASTTARWAVATNIVDWAWLVTPNIQLQYGLGQHVSLVAGGKTNHFLWRNNDPDREFHDLQNTLYLGARWWPWYTYSGWWVGAKAQYQEYNRGGIASRETEEGDAWGAGLSAGYTMMIVKHLNIDFGLGLWGGYKKYTRYSCPTCGKIVDSGEKGFILPDEVTVSLMFVF